MRVAPEFYRHIIGPGGATKRSVEKDGVSLTIPGKRARSKSDGQVITVCGRSESAVARATDKIQTIVSEVLPSVPYTHFLSIPMNGPACREAYRRFKTTALARFGGPGKLEDALFTKDQQLHMTLLMLRLPNPDHVEAAAATLRSLLPRLHSLVAGTADEVGEHPLQLRLRGLDCMKGNPSAVHVLHAKVGKGPASLLIKRLTGVMRQHLLQAGLLPGDESAGFTLKLHTTVVNSRFRSSRQGSRRQAFDAAPLLAMDTKTPFDLGSQALTEIHLSRRGRFRQSDGYYRPDLILPVAAGGAISTK